MDLLDDNTALSLHVLKGPPTYGYVTGWEDSLEFSGFWVEVYCFTQRVQFPDKLA